jgi:predicted PurR-regulated permease PerM
MASVLFAFIGGVSMLGGLVSAGVASAKYVEEVNNLQAQITTINTALDEYNTQFQKMLQSETAEQAEIESILDENQQAISDANYQMVVQRNRASVLFQINQAFGLILIVAIGIIMLFKKFDDIFD